jgi:hypothetical protein
VNPVRLALVLSLVVLALLAQISPAHAGADFIGVEEAARDAVD